ncbi:MAG: acyltransferase [Lachnospiraceae bacterium]|nr:acyltransferase [Lachnospiraceae bacterium]
MKKRNVSVEFARLIACIVVILCHCNFFAVYAPEDEFLHRVMISLLADSVGMFWLITGFYFLQAKSYGKLWLGTLKKVILPGLAIILFTRFFTDPIINGVPFSENPALQPEEIKRFFLSLITFRETGIYWYVFAYILVVLIQPVLKKLGEWLDRGAVRQLLFVIITLVLLIANDFSNNGLCHFSYSGIFVLIPAAIEVMWGHIIYQNRKWLMSLTMLVAQLILFVGVLMGRVAVYSYMLKQDMSSHVVSWYTGFGFVMATLVTLICMQIVREDREHSFDDAIRYPAGYTYPVYLIHPFLLSFARVRGLFKAMSEWLSNIFSTGVSAVFSVLIATLIFYFSSLVIAMALRWLCNKCFKTT